ncbi:hypothetical protein L873DRAFT_1809600 [Choiromyces venosus 120613-1]|uniref:Uncharacterized protein n=1 Tax=Choiromyces venosus 120613-1 TaxID=1336337 RepID=A0A3N4JH01_9PEZI|nr:hypothetical protein L873DRAFT_1809600 [Choiromyces venosus 120613-1]
MPDKHQICGVLPEYSHETPFLLLIASHRASVSRIDSGVPHRALTKQHLAQTTLWLAD